MIGAWSCWRGWVPALWYLGVGPFARRANTPKHGGDRGGEHGGGEKPCGEGRQAAGILALEPFIANLADDGGRRYLKATFQIDFGKGECRPG